jgi:sugar phosphate isomerase/epimerase
MPWHFCAVGDGRPDAEWVSLLIALGEAGYDGVISIEHEDPRYSDQDGIERSLGGLRRALVALEAPAQAG